MTLHYNDPVWGDHENKENKTFVKMIESSMASVMQSLFLYSSMEAKSGK